MNHVIHHIETPPGLTPPRLLAGCWEGKVLYVDSMNHVIHDIETPPGLTPPCLLPGGWEGKVLWVDSLNMMYHVVHIQSAHFGFPKRTLLRGDHFSSESTEIWHDDSVDGIDLISLISRPN